MKKKIDSFPELTSLLSSTPLLCTAQNTAKTPVLSTHRCIRVHIIMSFPTVLLHVCAYVQWFYHFCLFFHMQQESAEQDCSSPAKETCKEPDLNRSTPLWEMSPKLCEQQLHTDDLTTLSTTNRINSQSELRLHCLTLQGFL